jgi:hypothetical protein
MGVTSSEEVECCVCEGTEEYCECDEFNKALKKFKIEVPVQSQRVYYIEAESEEEATQMYLDGDFDCEPDLHYECFERGEEELSEKAVITEIDY